jgi:DNA-binding FrmR family transcriptional regulator
MDEQTLRNVITALLEYAKDDHDYCVSIGNEIAALRDALDELSSGKFLPILEKHRQRMLGLTAPIKARDASDYDELIRRLRGA